MVMKAGLTESIRESFSLGSGLASLLTSRSLSNASNQITCALLIVFVLSPTQSFATGAFSMFLFAHREAQISMVPSDAAVPRCNIPGLLGSHVSAVIGLSISLVMS